MFWFWHFIFGTALLIFSKYDSNFSCIAVSLFSKWRVSSVSNCSKVSVFCAEGLGTCLAFSNKGVSDWIGNWGVSFGVLGVSVWTESPSFCILLGSLGMFYFSLIKVASIQRVTTVGSLFVHKYFLCHKLYGICKCIYINIW